MVICKFFLQGLCRFGDHCKFEHQINDSYNTNKNQHTSILWQSQAGSSQYQNQPNNIFQEQSNTIFNLHDNSASSSGGVDIDTLIKSVINDMLAVEKGSQWLLSCYGPFKEKQVFPSFNDYSFEEIRYGFYEAVKSGTIEQYKQNFNGLLQQQMIIIKSLQKPTAEIVEILKNIYNTPSMQTSSMFGNASLTYGQNILPEQKKSIFAQGNQNLFANNAVHTPQFSGTAGSIFGGSKTISNQSQINSPNIFAQANANLASHSNAPTYGNQQISSITPTSTLFGQTSGQPNVFSSQSGSIFQQTNMPTTSSMFGNQNTSQFSPQTPSSTPNIFGGNQDPTNNFPQQAPTFAPSNFMTSTPQQVQQVSIFGNQTAGNVNNSPLFQAISTETNQNMNIFGTHSNPPPYDESVYSKLEDLTEEEIKWFQSDDLDPLKIPEKPPTFEMCFKT